ncbi:flavin reductase [Congzhengia sp.]|uniref:flavin reductase n=1 Tax=Congzhengia sp. TaxID=2944168 RepID=UPI0030779571
MDNSAFFKIGYGLYVLTAAENGKDNGCIVNTVIQATNTPNRLALAVNKQNYTCEMISHTKQFNISVLCEGTDFNMFKRFGFQSGKDTNKFEGFNDVKRSENGVYYVTKTTNAYFSGNVTNEIDMGTHLLFTADVLEAEVLSERETVTYTYYQDHIKPKPEEKKAAKGWRCKICGYVYEGEDLPEDFVCPICKHPASDFERI